MTTSETPTVSEPQSTPPAPAAQAADGAPNTAPVPQPPAEAPAAPQAPAGGAPAADSVDDLPEWAQREIRDARREAQNLRQRRESDVQAATDTARTELTQSLGRALGLIQEEDPAPDPEALVTAATQREQAATARARAAQIDLAVFRAAPSTEAANLLLDSRAFTDQVAALDPAADDFSAQVAAVVSSAVEANPTRYAARPQAAPANTGGSPITGAPTGGTDSIEDFRRDYRQQRGLAD